MKIKFRVWDKELKQYNSPNVHHLIKTGSVLEISLNLDIKKIAGEDRFVIQQYTGAKDKNGKKIYDGDILKIFWNDSYYTDRVMWNDLDKMWWPHSPLTWMIDSTEVIGTLFENPELLE